MYWRYLTFCMYFVRNAYCASVVDAAIQRCLKKCQATSLPFHRFVTPPLTPVCDIFGSIILAIRWQPWNLQYSTLHPDVTAPFVLPVSWVPGRKRSTHFAASIILTCFRMQLQCSNWDKDPCFQVAWKRLCNCTFAPSGLSTWLVSLALF